MWRAVVDVGFDPEKGARLQKARMSKTKDGAVMKFNLMLRERDSIGLVFADPHGSAISRQRGSRTSSTGPGRTLSRTTAKLAKPLTLAA